MSDIDGRKSHAIGNELNERQWFQYGKDREGGRRLTLRDRKRNLTARRGDER